MVGYSPPGKEPWKPSEVKPKTKWEKKEAARLAEEAKNRKQRQNVAKAQKAKVEPHFENVNVSVNVSPLDNLINQWKEAEVRVARGSRYWGDEGDLDQSIAERDNIAEQIKAYYRANLNNEVILTRQQAKEIRDVMIELILEKEEPTMNPIKWLARRAKLLLELHKPTNIKSPLVVVDDDNYEQKMKICEEKVNQKVEAVLRQANFELTLPEDFHHYKKYGLCDGSCVWANYEQAVAKDNEIATKMKNNKGNVNTTDAKRWDDFNSTLVGRLIGETTIKNMLK